MPRNRAASPTQRERLAYHEAGHAVALLDCRRGLKHITIVPGEGHLGRNTPAPLPSFHPDRDDGPSTRLRVEQSVVGLLGGAVAEAHLLGRDCRLGDFKRYGGAVDLARAYRLVCFQSAGDEEANAYLSWLFERTKSVIAFPQNWAAVKAIAQALLHQQELSGRAARRIYDAAVEEWRSSQL